MADRWLASRLIARARWHVPVDRRSCTRHPELAAVDRCDRCGQPFCARCLSNIERWRVCAPCLGKLQRERQGAPIRVRLGAIWREAVAVLAFGALMVGILVVISRGLGGGGSNAALGNAARTIGPKVRIAQQVGAAAPTPASLQLQVPLDAASPPAHIVLGGSGFQPNEQIHLTGVLSGQTAAGHVASVALVVSQSLPDGAVPATSAGDLGIITLKVANSSQFCGRYHVQIQAIGNKGSRAEFEMTAGGVPVPAP